MTTTFPEKIDIVTVCFDDDLPLMWLQARSLRLFMDQRAINRIHLISNSNSPEFEIALRGTVLPEYGYLRERVSIRHVSEYFPDSFVHGGWETQQVIKLLVSRHVSTDHYLILDAKNHFIRPTTLRSFFTEDGRAISVMSPHGFTDRLNAGRRLFGLENVTSEFPTMPVTTPYVAFTSMIREMIEEIETQHGCPFHQTFLEHRLAEFHLIFSYLCKTNSVEKFYAFDHDQATVSIWPHHSDQDIMRIIGGLDDWSGIVALGCHRMALKEMKPHLQALVSHIWKEAGLIADDEAAKRIFGFFKYQKLVHDSLLTPLSYSDYK